MHAGCVLFSMGCMMEQMMGVCLIFQHDPYIMLQVGFETPWPVVCQGGETMPNIKSAEKRMRQNEKRRLQNQSQKSALRTSLKAVEAACAQNDVERAKEALLTATKKLDKAVTKGLIHKNAAARKKSRLAKKINALAAAQQAQ